MKTPKTWRATALRVLAAERDAAPPTPLRELASRRARILFKDESAHPTGSLKHRLARALLMYGVRAGRIGPATPLFDASSGNTAVSEAWFARRFGLPYFAVIPHDTSPGKQRLIRDFGGECVLVDEGQCCKREAARLAHEAGGCFLDQFTNATPATDWRARNVMSEACEQLAARGEPMPDWFVTGAGTGGTSTCVGRYLRQMQSLTRVLVVDPEDSAFFPHYACSVSTGCLCASRVEGIGRPTVEPSFDASVIDRMLTVPDAASWAAARWLSAKLGQAVGVSTGTNLIGAIRLIDAGDAARVVTLICDDGARYAGRLDNDDWLRARNLDIAPWLNALDAWFDSGRRLPTAQAFASRSRTFA